MNTDIAEIQSIFNYDADTGDLIYKVSRGSKKAGSVAGYVHKSGYIQIEVKGKAYLAHRLAWLLFYGCWPENNIDHINHIKTDNRIANLRDVTQAENTKNRSLGIANTSGFLGVSLYKPTGKWVAKFSNKTIGYYDTPEMANEAYLAYKESIR